MPRRPSWNGWTASALACAALAACVAPRPEPTPAPAPAPVPTPTPTPTPAPAPPPFAGNWMDAPLTQGDWYFRATRDESMALFGPPEAEATFSLTCVRATRTIELDLFGDASQAVPMTIRTETRDATFEARPTGGEVTFMMAALTAGDPLLDAMAFSKGRFVVEMPGTPTLYLPSYPEITRVIEDCR